MAPQPKEYRAKDGTVTWKVRVRAGGKETSETFPNRTAALGFCARVDDIGADKAVRERALRDPSSDSYVPTLRQWYAEHMKNLTGVTEGTRQDYERIAHRVLLPMLGSVPLDLITPAEVAHFVNTLERTPALDNKGRPAADGHTLSAKTIAVHHGFLASLLQTAVHAQHIDSNPARGTRLPRAGEHERIDERYLTQIEYQAIEAALPKQWVPLVRLLVGTGLRWSEATALQARHLDPMLGTLSIRQAWKRPKVGSKRQLGPPKSHMSRRIVQVPEQVMSLLVPLVEGASPQDFIFRTSTGTALYHGPFHSRVWVPACERAGVVNPRPRIHDLRHTHASWMLAAGATLEEVQEQLGHESRETTRKIYGKLQPGQRAAIRATATRTLAFTDEAAQIEG